MFIILMGLLLFGFVYANRISAGGNRFEAAVIQGSHVFVVIITVLTANYFILVNNLYGGGLAGCVFVAFVCAVIDIFAYLVFEARPFWRELSYWKRLALHMSYKLVYAAWAAGFFYTGPSVLPME
jgi:hypothetical protein